MTGMAESYLSEWGMARSPAPGTLGVPLGSALKSLRGGVAMGNRSLFLAAALAALPAAAALSEPAGLGAGLRAPGNEVPPEPDAEAGKRRLRP